MKHIPAGINFWAGFDTVPTSKFEKMDDKKKIYKKIRNDIFIKKIEYFCNILQCHGPKIIGNRKVDKKIYKETNCQHDKN